MRLALSWDKNVASHLWFEENLSDIQGLNEKLWEIAGHWYSAWKNLAWPVGNNCNKFLSL
jgi:hypothetical protein